MAVFTNQAQLLYNNVVTNSNIAVGEILEPLTVTKNAVNTTYGQNDTITYVINLVNSSTTDLNALQMSDDLGAYPYGTLAPVTLYPLNYVAGTLQYYRNGILQATPAGITAGPPLVVSGISVPAGGNATILYQAVTTAYAPLGAADTIDNTVTFTGAGLAPIRATETIDAQSAPRLAINKSISPVPVTDNGTLTYTFVLENYGTTPIIADDNVIFSDMMNPILDPITVTYNNAPWTENAQYTYDETTGAFTTLPNVIEIPGATANLNPDTGAWTITPGTRTLVIRGTV